MISKVMTAPLLPIILAALQTDEKKYKQSVNSKYSKKKVKKPLVLNIQTTVLVFGFKKFKIFRSVKIISIFPSREAT